MGNGNSGNGMTHYQQQQQQQQYLQNQAQYSSNMQQHMNSFNYHHSFGRMQQQQQQQSMTNAVKNEAENDPYRFVDEDLSNGMNYHSNNQHMSSPANYSPASSSPHLPAHMQQQSQTGNASMMQYNEHMHGIVSHLNSHPQIQSQQQMMNGGGQNVGMPGGLNASDVASAGMMMNESPKKRGRKKKIRDENG